MFTLDPATLFLAKRKGVSPRDAVLFSATLSSAGATALGTAGQLILADKVTDKITVKSQKLRIAPQKIKAAPPALPKLKSGPLLTSGALLPIPKPAPAKPSPIHSIQKIKGTATTIDFRQDPPLIEGSSDLVIDFVSPTVASTYEWDFGDEKMGTSTSRNPMAKKYKNPGNFTVTLTTTDAAKNESKIEVAQIKIS